MSFLIREKSFYRTLIAISIPIALQNLISFAVSITGSVMLGVLGEVELSAASLANQVFFVFTLLSFGLANGGAVLINQYWGKKDTKTIGKITSMTTSVMFLVATAFTILILCFPSEIMRIYTGEASVIEKGIHYLRWAAPSYLFFGLSNTYAIMLRSVEQVKISLSIYAFSFIINLFFNWMLIFGHLGAPALGIQGAALSTVIARFFEFCAIGVYVLFFEKNAKISFRHMVHFERWLISDFFHHSIPIIFNELLWGIGASMHSAIFGRMGSSTVTASSIVSNVIQLNTVAIFGIGNAAGVLIGKKVGAKADKKNIINYAKTFELISLLVGLIAFSGVILLGNPIIELYQISQSTKQLAYNTMFVASAVVFFMSFEITNLVGILRAGGDGRFVLKIDLLFMWLVAIPLGFAAAFWFQWPLPAVYLCLRIDILIKAIISFVRIMKEKWIRILARDFA